MTAVGADDADFVHVTEPFRRELLAHCYRLLGSVDDAEDLVQETYLRAWRSYDRFEGRASVRTWLYRIATNACLTALEHHSRRVLPAGLGPPERDPSAAPEMAGPDVRWLQPIPTALVSAESGDPAGAVAAREGLRLALVASLQYLPGRQRAVLILRDVLNFPASDVAAILDITTVAVKSTLQRARARLREVSLDIDDVVEPSEPDTRALLDQYIAAFVSADIRALERLLSADVTLEAPPVRTWLAGCRTCIPYLRDWILGAAGDWCMLPTEANGRPAAAAYTRSEDGTYQAYGIVTLASSTSGISRIVAFGDPQLLAIFGFPSSLSSMQL